MTKIYGGFFLYWIEVQLPDANLREDEMQLLSKQRKEKNSRVSKYKALAILIS